MSLPDEIPPIKKFTYDPEKSWEENYRALEDHHHKEMSYLYGLILGLRTTIKLLQPTVQETVIPSAAQEPSPSPRAESAPMQFGEDWAGIFLRGKTAFALSMYLGQLIDSIDRGEEPSHWDLLYARQLVELLHGSDERGSLEGLQLMKSFSECLAVPVSEEKPGSKKEVP